jgi:hypothetical protein
MIASKLTVSRAWETPCCTASSPVELDAYRQAMQAQPQQDEALDHAHRQHLERLQYHAAGAERQFHRVAPDHRLGAAELERRWESALRALQGAQAADETRRATRTGGPALVYQLMA